MYFETNVYPVERLENITKPDLSMVSSTFSLIVEKIIVESWNLEIHSVSTLNTVSSFPISSKLVSDSSEFIFGKIASHVSEYSF